MYLRYTLFVLCIIIQALVVNSQQLYDEQQLFSSGDMSRLKVLNDPQSDAEAMVQAYFIFTNSIKSEITNSADTVHALFGHLKSFKDTLASPAYVFANVETLDADEVSKISNFINKAVQNIAKVSTYDFESKLIDCSDAVKDVKLLTGAWNLLQEYLSSKDASDKQNFMDKCGDDACKNALDLIVSFLDGSGTEDQDKHHCQLVSRLFANSPYDDSTYTGWRDYYMQKAAYVQSLANVALVIQGTYESYNSGDLQGTWKTVNDHYSPHFMVSCNIAEHFYQKGIDELFVLMVENATKFIEKFIDGGGQGQVDLEKVVNTLGVIAPDTLWQMQEIKGNEDTPLKLDLQMNPEYAFHWNMTLAFKGGPTHSFIMGMMPKNATGGEPSESIQHDVKLCAQRLNPKADDIFKYDCVTAAMSMSTSAEDGPDINTIVSQFESNNFEDSGFSDIYHECRVWSFKGLPCSNSNLRQSNNMIIPKFSK